MIKLKILAITLLLTGTYSAGFMYRDHTAQKEELSFIKKVSQYERELNERLDNVSIKEVEKEVQTTKYITKEVIKYVKSKPDSCTLNDGWVQLHDGAAVGSMPEDSETSNVSHDSTEAIITVTENYGNCRENFEKLKALQKWVDELTK